MQIANFTLFGWQDSSLGVAGTGEFILSGNKGTCEFEQSITNKINANTICRPACSKKTQNDDFGSFFVSQFSPFVVKSVIMKVLAIRGGRKAESFT
ncbi:hypothetical protein YK48G_23460 [Lentilactobacillus fungorum]|uniref:Uncharacterized protein n=1 Tax=Lentilactobacillus fungorum TaxID=2201250 RepID=A0ABQ3W419_9LACO|nr:hypothetical protein YK48G_23460 [Lentilactobacillus fungorum]